MKRKNTKVDLALMEEQSAIALQMERYIYSTDANRTRNPGYSPISLIRGANVDMQTAFTRYVMVNTTDETLKVKQDIQACEPGETIAITLRPPSSIDSAVAESAKCLQIVERSNRFIPRNRLIIQENICDQLEASDENSEK